MHAHELIVDACVHGVDEVYAPAIYLGTSGAFAAATKCASSADRGPRGAARPTTGTLERRARCSRRGRGRAGAEGRAGRLGSVCC